MRVGWIALLLILQCQTPSAPDYTQPGDFGGDRPEPPRHWWRSLPATPVPPGGDPLCRKHKFELGVIEDGVTCNQTFNFKPLLDQALAQRAGVRPQCPPRCNIPVEWINAILATCEQNNTRARVRVELGVECSAVPIPQPTSVPIPQTGPIGPISQVADFLAPPWNPEKKLDEGQNPNPVACGELLRYEYREAAACPAGDYTAASQRAFALALQRHNAIVCPGNCAKFPLPNFTYRSWDCQNGEIIFQIYFKSCAAPG
ncbi:MAG TPA: hypothetical protein VMS98_20440 [Thermoanaerobaculia bacterium]|nr:hypothetical protein [Thermoanaerobaculia bacterium]